MARITIQLIEDTARLREFLPEWTRFAERAPGVNPFQMPQWLLTWWQHLGSGKLHFLVFRHNAETVGVLPCFLHDWDFRRQLTLMGTGISDYLDLLLDARHCSAVVEAIQRHLESFEEWELCDWQDLLADTPLRGLGPAADDVPCSRVELGQSFEDFLAARPHGLRRNLRRYRERMRTLGRLRFAVSENADPELLSALIELHRTRWRESGEPGMIDSNRAEGFVRDIAKVLAGRGMLRIFTLYLQERIAAIVLALRDQGTIYSYLSAFDPEFETLGCGRELLACALRYAHTERYRWWDFLRGDEPYKLEWGAQLIPKCRLRLEPSPAARAARTALEFART